MSKIDLKKLGLNIKFLRKIKGISQEKLAEVINLFKKKLKNAPDAIVIRATYPLKGRTPFALPKTIKYRFWISLYEYCWDLKKANGGALPTLFLYNFLFGEKH